MKNITIGITLDLESTKSYSKFPWYAARQNYSDSVVKAGGTPVFIPHNEESISSFLDLIDGLVITGGDFDINPNLYGEKKVHKKVNLKNKRTNFELKIATSAIKKNIPILGICGGEQLLNVIFGGTLYQHIPDEFQTKINHEQTNPRDQASHNINIIKKSKLFSIVKTSKMFVNSAHHQSVKKIGKNLLASAFCSDGVIEAIEHKELNFCIGVQWHPEFLIDKNDIEIFKSFIKASKENYECKN